MADKYVPTYQVNYPDGAKFLTIGGSGLIYIFPSNAAEVLKVFSPPYTFNLLRFSRYRLQIQGPDTITQSRGAFMNG